MGTGTRGRTTVNKNGIKSFHGNDTTEQERGAGTGTITSGTGKLTVYATGERKLEEEHTSEPYYL
jgi:hypothetical protein